MDVYVIVFFIFAIQMIYHSYSAPDVEAATLRSRLRTGPTERLLVSDDSELEEPLRGNGWIGSTF